jgi:hypothetical protein
MNKKVIPPGTPHKEVLAKALQDSEVKKEYEALGVALTPEEMTAINRDMPIGAKYGEVFAEIAKAQRRKVAERLKKIIQVPESDTTTTFREDFEALVAELEE